MIAKDNSQRRRKNAIDWALITLCVIMVVYIVCIMADLWGSRVSKVQMLRIWIRVCHSCAHTFGQWGLKAENEYFRILESERMI